MHFIDYLPWPIYILMGILSIFALLFVLTNSKANIQEKIGAVMMICGVIAILVEKIVEEKIFHIRYNVFIDYMPFTGIVGLIVLFGSVVKRVDDPVKKKELKIYYILICIFSSLLMFLALY